MARTFQTGSTARFTIITTDDNDDLSGTIEYRDDYEAADEVAGALLYDQPDADRVVVWDNVADRDATDEFTSFLF